MVFFTELSSVTSLGTWWLKKANPSEMVFHLCSAAMTKSSAKPSVRKQRAATVLPFARMGLLGVGYRLKR
jgi:hypothetical protein